MKEMQRSGVHLDLGALDRGEHRVELTTDHKDVDLDDRFSDISVDVHVLVTSIETVAIIDARAKVALICDRTLVLFEQEIGGSSTVLLATDTEREATDYDDVLEINPADQHVDLTGTIRDTLLLAVPSRAVAPGADDVEIRTRFGNDDNETTDPRWDGLKDIRSTD